MSKLPRVEAREGRSIPQDASRAWADGGVAQLEECRLAGAAGPNQGDDFTGLDMEANVPQDA